MTSPIIDAHVHVWSSDAERFPWRPLAPQVPVPEREAAVTPLLTAMDEAGVTQAVLVQPSTYGYDHTYLRTAIAAAPERFVAVGLVDPFAPDAASRLAVLAAALPLRGIRLRMLGEAGRAILDAATATELLQAASERTLVVSVLTDPTGLKAVAAMARRHPHLRIVIDHLGSPGRGGLADQAYRQRLLQLSAHHNVSLKLSGFYAISSEVFPHLDCRPLVEHVVATFGMSRLVWGSDYPYIVDACSYAASVGQLDRLLPGLCRADRSRLLHDTAHRLWW